MRMGVKQIAVATIIAVSAFATMAESSSSGDGDTVVETVETAAETTSPEESLEVVEETEDSASSSSSGVGTRDNPAPLGTVVRIGDWEVTVTDVTKNANKLVANENQFNDKPAEGFQYVLWSIDAKYVGDSSATFWIDSTWKVVGSEGNSFDDSCGVIPNNISDAGETFSGASITGNVCKAVQKDQLPGATILVEASFSVDSDRTFFAIP